MTDARREWLTGLLLRHTTAIIFIVVFLYFGISAVNFFRAASANAGCLKYR